MRFKIFSPVILMLLCASLAHSEEVADGVYELGEIVVSASRLEAESVGTTRTLSALDIASSGAHTLDEAIDLLPGVYVRVGAAGTPRVDIRGFRTRHVKLLLDGIPIHDTYDGQFDPTIIPVENIAKIKLTTGGGSVLYGSGGNGGIINIVTKTGTRNIQGTVKTEMGQSDTYLGKLTFSSASDTWNIFVSGSPSKRDGYRLSDDFSATKDEDGDLRDNSDRKRNNLFASISYKPSDRALYGLTFSYVQGEHGVPPVANYDKKNTFTKKPKYDRMNDLEGYSAQWATRYAFNRPFTFKSWAHFSQLKTIEDRYDNASYNTQAKNGASHAGSTTQVVGANTQIQCVSASQGIVTLGLSIEHNTWQSEGFSVDKKDKRNPFDEDRDLQLYNAALQYDLSPKPEVGLVAGLSYHHQNRTGSSGGDVAYLFGGRLDVHENTRLKVSLSRKVRFPSIRQLYDPKAGNTDLGAERTMHYELGVTQTLAPGTTLSATGFVIDANDFIEKEGNNPYLNYETYRFQGFEIGLKTQPIDGLALDASYAYLSTEDQSSGTGKDELQNRPRDKISITGTYRFPFGLTTHASMLYVGNQYFYDSSTPLQKKALDDYTLVNVNLNQALIEQRLSLYLGVDNLFDKNYEQSYGLPQPGRMAYAGLNLKY